MTRTGVTGDFRGLAKLRMQLDGLASREFRYVLAMNLAQEARSQILRGFQEQRDPYGKPWKPSASRRAGLPGAASPVLVDRAMLRNSIAPRTQGSVPGAYGITPDGFTIGTNLRYAAIHQYGGIIRAKKTTVKTVSRRLKDGRIITYQQRFGGLRFQVVTGHQFARKTKDGIQRLKKPKAVMSDWITVSKVTVPRRQFMPEGDLGPIWGEAFARTASEILLKHMEGR